MSELVRVTTVAEIDEKKLCAFDVDGERIAVAALDKSYYAFDDTCPHRGCSLSEGKLLGTMIVCPCHGSEFDVITGKRLAGPAQRDIRTFRVRIEGDEVEIDRGS